MRIQTQVENRKTTVVAELVPTDWEYDSLIYLLDAIVHFLRLDMLNSSCLLRTFFVLLLLHLYSLFLAYTNIWVSENERTALGRRFNYVVAPKIYYIQVLVWISMSRFV